MGKKSAAPTDITGAATIEGEFSQDTARDTIYADRPDQYNALGSNTWQQEMVTDPATGEKTTKWTQNQTLSPEMQSIFDSDMQRNQSLGNTANSLNSRINSEMGAPLEWGQFGEGQLGPEATTGDDAFSWSSNNRGRAEDDAYARSTNRLDPRFEKERATMERTLTNRGLRAGDSAYDSAMESFGTTKNDAYEQARLGATAEGRTEDSQAYGQAQGAWGTNRATEQQRFNQGSEATNQANALRSQQIQEYLGKRQQSLNESNALKGAQTTSETISNFGSGG